MKIEQIIRPDNAKGKKFVYDSSHPHIQKFTNLFNDDDKCVFKLMQSNDIDIGSYFDFFNEDGTIKFHFSLDTNGELDSYTEYKYENVGRCKKQILHLVNLKKNFEEDGIFYLDNNNNVIDPEFKAGTFFSNEEYLQAQLEIVKQINSKQE
ncbi:MAG: hypothetical protein J6J33_03785 [Clostridia bacterium]|nr:hypothetical protein [Clostridia bacterium]